MQCCNDHITAAAAGHVRCLERLRTQGKFLGSEVGERAGAGEASKAQLWDAALKACERGHAHVLRWLFRGGWPASVDASPDWLLTDLARLPLGWGSRDEFYIPGMSYGGGWLIEVNLCRYAMRDPSTNCLKALLDVGCRSDWMCPLAALEGCEERLALVVEHECTCDVKAIYVAARGCSLRMLEAACWHFINQASRDWAEFLCNSCGRRTLDKSIEVVAKKGSAACLEALLSWFYPVAFAHLEAMQAAARGAAERGHVDCLEVLQRCLLDSHTMPISAFFAMFIHKC